MCFRKLILKVANNAVLIAQVSSVFLHADMFIGTDTLPGADKSGEAFTAAGFHGAVGKQGRSL